MEVFIYIERISDTLHVVNRAHVKHGNMLYGYIMPSSFRNISFNRKKALEVQFITQGKPRDRVKSLCSQSVVLMLLIM